MISFFTKNYFLVLIIFLAFLLRFYQLGQVPPSLNWDETSNGYNAYSILKTARDENGNFLPLTFRSFGDYNAALSVYTLVPSIAIFGLNEFAVRFPSALLGTLTVLLTYLLTKKLFENSSLITHHSSLKNIALIAMFFLAISPWHLHFSRYDHEANFMVFFSILGLVLLLHSFKKPTLLIFSAIAFGLALNTYHAAKIWVPLFMLVVFVFFGKKILSHKSKLLIPFVVLALSALPILVNLERATIRSSSVGILKEKSPLKTFREGYLSHFSLNYLFVSGDNIRRHSVAGMGQLYVAELPLIIIGLISLIKNKSLVAKFLLAWLLIAPIPASLATPTPHALRSLTFMPIWHIISAFGLVTIFTWSKNKKSLAGASIAFVSILLAYNFVTYLHLYYKHYPKLASIDWQDGHKEMINFISPIKDNYSTVAVTKFYGHPYIFILFYTKFDPRTYQMLQDKSKFDKYEFFGDSWDKKTPGLALVVRPEWQKPNPPPKYIKEIKDSSGQVVFRISEEE